MKGRGIRFSEPAAFFRARPAVALGLESEILPIGRPSTATLGGRSVPAGEQRMQVCPVDRNLPERTQTVRSAADSESNHRTVRRPGEIQHQIWQGNQLVWVAAVTVRQLKVVPIAVHNP